MIRKTEAIKVGTEIIGNRVRARVVKNKVAAPFKKAEMEILYDSGISKEGSIIDIGTEKDIIRKSGAFYSYKDTRLGQGRESARIFLRDNMKIRNEIEDAIRNSEEVEKI